jgi:hypothetical protein
MHSIVRLVAILATGLSLTGCQVLWASITSPSDWVSGSSTSLSGSSEGFLVSSGSGGHDGGGTAYLDDVRVLTAAVAADGGSADEFLREVGRLSAAHGVAHWEDEAGTYRAIGAGLFDAGVEETEIGAALGELGADGPHDAPALVLEGYRTAAL